MLTTGRLIVALILLLSFAAQETQGLVDCSKEKYPKTCYKRYHVRCPPAAHFHFFVRPFTPPVRSAPRARRAAFFFPRESSVRDARSATANASSYAARPSRSAIHHTTLAKEETCSTPLVRVPGTRVLTIRPSLVARLRCFFFSQSLFEHSRWPFLTTRDVPNSFSTLAHLPPIRLDPLPLSLPRPSIVPTRAERQGAGENR